MIKWSAVFVSWVVDIGGSSVFGVILIAYLIASGQLIVAMASDQRAVSAMLFERTDLFAVSMAGGTFFSLLAGYVCARLAGRAFLLHGLLSAVACLASDAAAADQLRLVPFWLMALSIAFAPAAGGLGGLIRQFEVSRSRQRDMTQQRITA